MDGGLAGAHEVISGKQGVEAFLAHPGRDITSIVEGLEDRLDANDAPHRSMVILYLGH